MDNSVPLSVRPLIDRKRFAALLGICDKTLGLWISQHKVPEPIKLSSKRHRWRPEVVEKFIRELQADDAAQAC